MRADADIMRADAFKEILRELRIPQAEMRQERFPRNLRNMRVGRKIFRKALVELLGADAPQRGRPRKRNSPK